MVLLAKKNSHLITWKEFPHLGSAGVQRSELVTHAVPYPRNAQLDRIGGARYQCCYRLVYSPSNKLSSKIVNTICHVYLPLFLVVYRSRQQQVTETREKANTRYSAAGAGCFRHILTAVSVDTVRRSHCSPLRAT
jgi:hypothetical protein